MRTIEVNLDKDPYKVLYSDLQQGIQTIQPESINGRKIAIISDDHAANNNLDVLRKALSRYDIKIIEIILSPGEKNKELMEKILKKTEKENSRFNISSTPTFVINDKHVISGALKYNEFVKKLKDFELLN